jgi:hypothetical protein
MRKPAFPSKEILKMKLIYLICFLFTIGGLYILWDSFQNPELNSKGLFQERIVAAAVTYFFGMCGIMLYVLKKDTAKINQHISHHLNTIIIKGSRAKNTAAFFGCLGFVWIGLVLVIYPEQFDGNYYKKVIGGWSCVVFFGFCLMLFLSRFFRNNSAITINEKGIAVNAQLRKFSYLWEDIDTFETFEIKNNKMISIILSESGSKKRKQYALVRKINQVVSKDSRNMESISASVFEIGHNQLLDLLRTKLTQHKTKKEPV